MKKLLLIMVLTAFPLISHAHFDRYEQRRNDSPQHFWNKVEWRMDNQFHRIKRGIRSGELTRWESKKLRHEQRKIARFVDHIHHKRCLTHHDRRKIIARLDRARENIAHLVNNNRLADRHDFHSHEHHYRDHRYVNFPDRDSRIYQRNF